MCCHIFFSLSLSLLFFCRIFAATAAAALPQWMYSFLGEICYRCAGYKMWVNKWRVAADHIEKLPQFKIAERKSDVCVIQYHKCHNIYWLIWIVKETCIYVPLLLLHQQRQKKCCSLAWSLLDNCNAWSRARVSAHTVFILFSLFFLPHVYCSLQIVDFAIMRLSWYRSAFHAFSLFMSASVIYSIISSEWQTTCVWYAIHRNQCT